MFGHWLVIGYCDSYGLLHVRGVVHTIRPTKINVAYAHPRFIGGHPLYIFKSMILIVFYFFRVTAFLFLFFSFRLFVCFLPLLSFGSIIFPCMFRSFLLYLHFSLFSFADLF